MPRKHRLFKNIALEYDLSCISGKMVFFSGKYDIFSFDRKWKMIFLNKYIEIWYFPYICIDVANMILPFWKENQISCSTEKTHLKLTEIHRRFHILLSNEKKSGNLIYRIEIWLLFQLLWLDIFYNEGFPISCTIQPSGVVFRGVLEHQLKKLFVH